MLSRRKRGGENSTNLLTGWPWGPASSIPTQVFEISIPVLLTVGTRLLDNETASQKSGSTVMTICTTIYMQYIALHIQSFSRKMSLHFLRQKIEVLYGVPSAKLK